MNNNQPNLSRKLGLLPLVATGVCSMLGASVYIMPFMIHRSVPEIGPYVLLAFAMAGVPALLAGLCYAMLSMAMPHAGGSYLYVSRSVSPFWGFIASFSQWFGLSITIGVIAYMIVPFARDAVLVLGWNNLGESLMHGSIRVPIALSLVWLFCWVNIKGLKSYEKTLIPLMVMMFLLAGIVIIAGFFYDHTDFQSVTSWSGENLQDAKPFSWLSLVAATAVLFSSFIGFDSIAQAGGEAINPKKNLPKAILITLIGVGTFYFVFTAAVYHAVPWQYVSQESLSTDLTAAGLLSHLLSPTLSAAIILGATIALINDLPAMILSVSRLLFAWSEDRVFPKALSKVHQTNNTPYRAIIASGLTSSVGILGCHFAGDFFLGIDIMVTAMLVNFLLICVSVLFIQKKNPVLAAKVELLGSWTWRKLIAITGIILLASLLVIHINKDLSQEMIWYFHSTWVWILVMAIGAGIYFYHLRKLKQSGVNIEDHFNNLPES